MVHDDVIEMSITDTQRPGLMVYNSDVIGDISAGTGIPRAILTGTEPGQTISSGPVWCSDCEFSFYTFEDEPCAQCSDDRDKFVDGFHLKTTYYDLKSFQDWYYQNKYYYCSYCGIPMGYYEGKNRVVKACIDCQYEIRRNENGSTMKYDSIWEHFIEPRYKLFRKKTVMRIIL